MKTEIESKKFSEGESWEGWSILQWAKGNWKTLKELVKVGCPLLFGLAVFRENPALIGAITVIGKLGFDSIEFYFSKVEMKK